MYVFSYLYTVQPPIQSLRQPESCTLSHHSRPAKRHPEQCPRNGRGKAKLRTASSVSAGGTRPSHGAMMSVSVDGGACGCRSCGGRKSSETSSEMDEVADAMSPESRDKI